MVEREMTEDLHAADGANRRRRESGFMSSRDLRAVRNAEAAFGKILFTIFVSL
jgi:hypothetical protein